MIGAAAGAMRALLLLALLLTGCNTYLGDMLVPAEQEWTAEAAGFPVDYRLARIHNFGVAGWAMGRCTIVLQAGLGESHLIAVAAHELGHCIDGAYLGWSSNNFGSAGCAYGGHYCKPSEGFAEAYAQVYLEKCGYNPRPLGLRSTEPHWPCELPDWHEVTPERAGLR